MKGSGATLSSPKVEQMGLVQFCRSSTIFMGSLFPSEIDSIGYQGYHIVFIGDAGSIGFSNLYANG